METIDGKKCYSVPEYAAAIGTSRSTAYRRLQRDNLKQYVKTRDGHLYVDAAAVSADSGVSKPRRKAQNETKNTSQKDSSETVTDALTNLFRDQLAAKDAEITRLHEELDRLHGDVEELHKLLDQAHQLLAMRDTKELEAPQRRRWRRR